MRCNCYVPPVEKPFVRPKSRKNVASISNTVVANPLVTTATPATLYALGKCFIVDTGMIKVKEVAINFKSSGSVPKLKTKANTAKLVNFVGNAPKVVIMVDELSFGGEEEESSEPSKN